MSLTNVHRNWLLGLVGGATVAGAAVGFAERPAGEPPQVDAQEARQGLHGARELSEAFRGVAREAMPSVVSIEVTGKAPQLAGGRRLENPLGDLENSPFRRFFESDPQLRRFLEEGGQLREMPQRPAPRSRGMGSGFIIDESGVILTNNHVVENAEKVIVRLQNGRQLAATKWKTDPSSDVAVVWVDPKGETLQPISLGNSDAMEIGDWVLAVGSPFGLDLTVTQGIISATGRAVGITQRGEFLQTDAAINPGNSGGPLLNLEGEVIGINTAISTESGGYDGIGFAIPISKAKWIADQLVETGTVRRAYLGVTIQPVDARLADAFGTQVGRGVVVTQVLEKSPAADAGLKVGDVILSVEGREVHSTRNLQGIIEQLQTGKDYTLSLARDGSKQDVTFRVSPLPEDLALAEREDEESAPSEPVEEESYNEVGLQVQELTPRLAKQLRLGEDVQGVVVTGVESDSPAAAAGLQTGDVIEKVANQRVASVEDFESAIEKADLDEGLLLFVRNATGPRFVVIEK